MLAILIPILNSVLGGIIKPFVAAWTDYERTKLTTGEAGFEAAAKSDAAVMQAALINDAQFSAMKVSLYGTPTFSHYHAGRGAAARHPFRACVYRHDPSQQGIPRRGLFRRPEAARAL